MKKRFSAFLLAALMVAALLPAVSMAANVVEVATAEALLTAIKNAQSGDTVKLIGNIETDTWPYTEVKTGVTIDGAGHKLKFRNIVDGDPSDDYNSQTALHGTGYTVQNLTIERTQTDAGQVAILITNGFVDNVTIEGTIANGVNAYGTSRITNSTFNNRGSDICWGVYSDNATANLTISGCTFNSVRAAQLYGTEQFTNNTVNSTKGVSVAICSTATVTGNTFTGARAVSNHSTDMTFTGNNLTSATKFESDVNVTVSGNYWGQAGGPSASQLSGNTGIVIDDAPLASDPTAPAYAGPVMNWVKVNAAENGVVKSGPLAASAGATITLYPKAAEGYVLDTVTVLDAEGSAVELDGLKFQIPAGGVTVSATFKLAD